MSARPWMPLYVGDYLAKTAHLTTLQHGAYLLLIMHYWANGNLPSDDRTLARICKLDPRQWKINRAVLAGYFDENWKHDRIEQEIRKASEISLKRQVYGGIGGRMSKGKDNVTRFRDHHWPIKR